MAEITQDYEKIREKPAIYAGANTRPIIIVAIIVMILFFLITISKPQTKYANYLPIAGIFFLLYLVLSRQKVMPNKLLSLPQAEAITYFDLHDNIKLQKLFLHKMPEGEILIDGDAGDLLRSPWTGEPWVYLIPFTIVDRSANRRYYRIAFTSPYMDGIGLQGIRKLPRPWTGYDMDKIIVYKKPEEKK